jgi:hypothetical protein
VYAKAPEDREECFTTKFKAENQHAETGRELLPRASSTSLREKPSPSHSIPSLHVFLHNLQCARKARQQAKTKSTCRDSHAEEAMVEEGPTFQPDDGAIQSMPSKVRMKVAKVGDKGARLLFNGFDRFG